MLDWNTMFMLDYYNLMLSSFRLLGIFSVLLKVGEQLRLLGMMPIAALLKRSKGLVFQLTRQMKMN
jgi:hypothetical protein